MSNLIVEVSDKDEGILTKKTKNNGSQVEQELTIFDFVGDP